MTEKVKFGCVSYDVPVKNRKAYAKLRALFKRKAIMQTASCYLILWSMADDVEGGIHKINTDKDGTQLPAHLQVRYNIFKYDEEVSGKELAESASSAMQGTLANAKDQINRLVATLKTEDFEDEFKVGTAVKSAKVSCRRAMSKLRDARALALLFNLTSDLNAGFLAYEAYVMAKKDEIDVLIGK